MLGMTAFALAWISQEVTPSQIVEATIFQDGALLKRSINIPDSGVVVFSPSDDTEEIWISEESNGKVRQISLDGDFCILYAVPNASISLYSIQKGLRWSSGTSIKLDQGRLAFGSSLIIANNSENLESVSARLSSGSVWSCASENQNERVNISIAKMSTASKELPLGTNDLEYNPCSTPVIYKSSLDAFHELTSFKETDRSEEEVFSEIKSLSLAKGNQLRSILANGYYPYQLESTIILPISYNMSDSGERQFRQTSFGRMIISGVSSKVPPNQLYYRIFGSCGQLDGNTVSSQQSNTAVLETGPFVRVNESWKEVGRRKVFASKQGEVREYDLVTVRAAISIENLHDKGQDVLVTKAFAGRFIKVPSAISMATGVDENSYPNKLTAFQWKLNVKRKSSKTFTYEYELFEKSQ
ncbi:MAG: hypothetical protein KF824_07125 [Fimbriimonadaceae bacterium]|nr:MAG: hypothetical protein KF824_07125 [Fimbriimonadaceae bacterium]